MTMVPEEQQRIRDQIVMVPIGRAPLGEHLQEFPKFSNQSYILLEEGIRRKVDRFVPGLPEVQRDPQANGHPVTLHHIINKSKWLQDAVWHSLYNRVHTSSKPIDVKVLLAIRNYIQEFNRHSANFTNYSLFNQFIWNPGNLFTGPAPQDRTDDPEFAYVKAAYHGNVNEEYALRCLNFTLLKEKLQTAINIAQRLPKRNLSVYHAAINSSQEQVLVNIDHQLCIFFEKWKEIIEHGPLVGVFERDTVTPASVRGHRELRLSSIISATDFGGLPSTSYMTAVHNKGKFLGG